MFQEGWINLYFKMFYLPCFRECLRSDWRVQSNKGIWMKQKSSISNLCNVTLLQKLWGLWSVGTMWKERRQRRRRQKRRKRPSYTGALNRSRDGKVKETCETTLFATYNRTMYLYFSTRGHYLPPTIIQCTCTSAQEVAFPEMMRCLTKVFQVGSEINIVALYLWHMVACWQLITELE